MSERVTAMERNAKPGAGGGDDRDEQLVAAADTTGLDRMTLNVLSNWGGQLVFVAAGFFLPRLIDRHVGQVGLGIWDFGWSLVSFLSLAALGIGSSVSRHIALHRATNDVEGVRRTVSSVMSVNLASGLAVIVMTGMLVWSLDDLFAARLGSYTHDARWLVALLGAAMAIEMTFSTFSGVMKGCHRWDLHNAVEAGCHGATVLAMIVALSLGGGLKSLAIANLAGVVTTEVIRAVLAYRICPELSIRLAYVEWPLARRMLLFGAKSLTVGVSQMMLIQTSTLLTAIYLGPASVALLSRLVALPRTAGLFGLSFAAVLTPTAGSLQASGRYSELREFLIESTRSGTYLQLPLLISLGILGDPILRLWMGPRYEHGWILAILVAGTMLPQCQHSVTSILIGMNLHARVALASLGRAVFGIGLSIFTLGVLRWGLAGLALAVALPTMANGIFIPLYACRQLGITPKDYVRRVFAGPVACVMPYALCLVAIRLLFPERPLLAIVCGGAAGVLVLAPLYWRYALPGRIRRKVTGYLGKTLRLADSLRT